MVALGDIGSKTIGTMEISWVPPLEDQVKINLDGASKSNLDGIGCDGLIRDMNGHWQYG